MRPDRLLSRSARALALQAALCAVALSAARAQLGVYVPAAPGSISREDVSAAPLDAQSGAVIAWLEAAGGWGTGSLRIDFSIEVLRADASAPVRAFTPTADHYSPDCDLDPVPVPAGGALEGESGYACDHDGDCHLIVLHTPTQRLFEMWRAHIVGSSFQGGCLAVWSTQSVYSGSGRGEGCTSADAGGLPIAPLLFSADEVAAGSIDHAIRFILPNARIRNRVYVHPATHSTGATSGASSAPPYGARFRLRASYPLASLPNEGARIVARALQRYGMILTDAGNIALTAQSDRFTQAKWAGRLGPRDLDVLHVSDFEMVEGGPHFTWNGDCERTPGPPGRPELLLPTAP
jgi:serine/threonine-protein kinase